MRLAVIVNFLPVGANVKYAVPIGGEFIVDVDSYLRKRAHNHSYHPLWDVCEGCLEISKHVTLEICDRIQANYSNVTIVFSGKRGFHIRITQAMMFSVAIQI